MPMPCGICHGHAFIDRALYLPKEWTDDPDRLVSTYVPSDTGFATKPKLATRMIARAITASVPFRWVAGDTVYVLATSSSNCVGQAKAMCLGSAALTYSDPGASGDPSLAPPRTSRRRGARPTGNACRRVTGPKARGCTIDVISNWQISMPGSSTAQMTACGHAAC